MSTAPLGSRLSLADFLCPTALFAVPALLTDPEAVFLERVGLKTTSYTHRQVFDKMVDEAYRALCRCKTPLYREKFEEDVFDRVAISIYQSASRTTLPLYDLMGGEHQNWVTRWLLWHVMSPTPREFSDTASGVTRSTSGKSDETALTCTTPLTPWSPHPPGTSGRELSSPGSTSGYWDPIRDR